MMPNKAARRCFREYRDVVQSEEMAQGEMRLEMIRGNWRQMRGEIRGPPDTPYEGGRFKLRIDVPDQYPCIAPKVHFTSFIWHPNISSVTGYICLDILKDRWSPILSLRTILLSVQVLLSSAEPDDPQDLVVATQCKECPDVFETTAKHWTNVYANGPHVLTDCDEKVARVVEMGVDTHSARVALSMCNWDLQAASESLFPMD